MTKPRIISGIQPTGKLHLGNYLGSLKHFIELQDSGKYDCFFFIADLHSLTENYDPKEKQAQVLDTIATFLALGLDPKKSTLFLQSAIPAHTQLAWIFNTLTPMGELERMTQYKDKANRQKNNVNVGLFTYPILMAADILIYKPFGIPVQPRPNPACGAHAHDCKKVQHQVRRVIPRTKRAAHARAQGDELAGTREEDE